MKDFVYSNLNKKDQSPWHKQMLADCLALVESSRRTMSENWPTWDRNEEVFRCKRTRDAKDDSAATRKEPEKMVVPLSYAQTMTFVAFAYSLITQRESMFELSGFKATDEKPAQVGEALLNRDLDYNAFPLVLVQFLLNVSRFGIGILKNTWITKKRVVKTQKTIEASSVGGMLLSAPYTFEQEEEVVEYQGNQITNISPYRFYPDPNVPITRFQEGAFCASEELYTYEALKQLEYEGVVSGVDYITPCNPQFQANHGFTFQGANATALQRGAEYRGDGQVQYPIIVTELQRELIPSKYKVDDKPIGNEDYPIKYVIWLANGERVIKCEPMGFDHNEFTYTVSPFTYDDNAGCLTYALSDVIDALQQVISWFINARITNVTKIISDKLVINTAAVNMDDITQRRPIIRLTAAATGDISRHIQQLKLQDVTTNHIGDVKFLQEIMQYVTGITDLIQGVMQPGRKSAAQINKTTASAATRLKMLVDSVWFTGIAPLGKQMLSNLRQGLEQETYVKLMGMTAVQTPEFLPVSKADLIGQYQFNMYDGTQQSDRHYVAQALEELMSLCLSNPQAAAVLGLDARKLLLESLRLRNIRNAERFLLDPIQQQQQLLMTNGLQQPTPGGSPAAVAAPTAGPANPGLPQPDLQSILSSIGASVGS